MSIKLLIQAELARIHSQGGVGRLEVDTGRGRLVCQLAAVDGIGCALETFVYQTDKLAGATMDQLKKLSDALTSKLNYLLEPITPLEADAESCTVQCRSSPPQQGDDGRSYYELLVRRGGEVALCRFHKKPGQPRQLIPAEVTRQVLERLAADFAAVVG